MSNAYLEAVAGYDHNIREMRQLRFLAAKHNLDTSRCDATLEAWVSEWERKHPRLAALLHERHDND